MFWLFFIIIIYMDQTSTKEYSTFRLLSSTFYKQKNKGIPCQLLPREEKEEGVDGV